MPNIENYVLPNGEIDWEAYYVDVDTFWGNVVDRLNGHHWLVAAA